jgi:hypothetical protein
MTTTITRQQLIPWSWAITPLNTTSTACPGPGEILGIFAGENLLVSIISLIAGHRAVVYFFTCGNFGKHGSNSWMYMWLLQVGIMLGANAINAHITVSAAGYDTSRMPAVWDLMLFYCTRPRLSWIVTGVISYTRYSLQRVGKVKIDHGDGPWDNAVKTSSISELVMQLIGLYYKGRTVNFAVTNGYFHLHALDGVPFKSEFHLMAIATLFYLITAPFILTGSFATAKYFIPVFVFACIPWGLSWLFITGYTLLAADL